MGPVRRFPAILGSDGGSGLTAAQFFGRQEERAQFDRTIADVRSGRLQVVLVGGPPGIGKTRLAEEFARAAEASGFLVLSGAWREDVALPEFWVWRQVLRRLLDTHGLKSPGQGLDTALSELSGLLPELRDDRPDLPRPLSGGGVPSRLRLLDAACRLLRRSAARQPLMIALDNLHLSGAASRELATGLVEELADIPLLLLGAYRDPSPAILDGFLSFLELLLPRTCVRGFRLGGLGASESARLLESELGSPCEQTLSDEIFRVTLGHPLYIREAAGLLRERLASGELLDGDIFREDLPRAISGIIRRRFCSLSPAGREILLTASLVGEQFSREELLWSGAEIGEAESALREAEAQGFVEKRAGGYRFSHAVVHEAIRLEVPHPKTRSVCARLAREAEAAEADLESWAFKLAAWWAAADGSEKSAKSRDYTRRAAESALKSGAWEQAAELFGRLLDVKSPPARTEEEADIRFGLGCARFLGGDRALGLDSLRRAFDWYRACGNQARMIEIATLPAYLHSGDPGFYCLFEELLKSLPSDSPALGAVLVSYGVVQFNNLGDYAGSQATLSKALEFGKKEGDCDLQARCLVALAFIDNRMWRFREAREKVDRAAVLLEGSSDMYALTHYNVLRYQIMIDMGSPDGAVPFLDRWIELAVRERDAFGVGASCFSRCRVELLSGDWDSARRFIDEGLAAMPDHVFLLSCRCFLEYAVGNFPAGDAFRRRLLAKRARTPSGPYTAHVHMASTAIARAWQSGDTREIPFFVPLLRRVTEYPGAHPFIVFRARVLLAFAAALSQDVPAARQAYGDIKRLPALYMIRPYHTERALALAARTYGDPAASAAHFREALRWTRHYKDRPAEAWMLCELGEALAVPSCGPQELEEARRSLSASRDAAVRLGMMPLVSRSGDRLANLSRLLEKELPAQAQLTERELEILGLIAEGLTNKAVARRLNISIYTVGNHMRNILEKTGAANRTEAVAFARRQGLLE